MEVRVVEVDPEYAQDHNGTFSFELGHDLVHVVSRVYSGELKRDELIKEMILTGIFLPFQAKIKRRKRLSLVQLVHGVRQQSPRSKAGQKWLAKIKKGQVAPKGLHFERMSFLFSPL